MNAKEHTDAVKRSCVDCGVVNCRSLDALFPDFCLSSSLTDEDVRTVKEQYEEPEIRKIALVSAEIEADFYLRYTRVEETVAFARRMGYRKIGIATCVGLLFESRIFAEILRKNGFEVYSAACKVGSFNKALVGFPEEKTKTTGAIMCNPILQARLLNRNGTDFNVVIGLCVGHDSLFYKYSDALCTTLIAKDRVLGHNPAAVLYQTRSYACRLLREPIAE